LADIACTLSLGLFADYRGHPRRGAALLFLLLADEDLPEEPVHLIVNPGVEEQLIVLPGRPIIAEVHPPQTINHDDLPIAMGE
jgi:hypothetical protein